MIFTPLTTSIPPRIALGSLAAAPLGLGCEAASGSSGHAHAASIALSGPRGPEGGVLIVDPPSRPPPGERYGLHTRRCANARRVLRTHVDPKRRHRPQSSAPRYHRVRGT